MGKTRTPMPGFVAILLLTALLAPPTGGVDAFAVAPGATRSGEDREASTADPAAGETPVPDEAIDETVAAPLESEQPFLGRKVSAVEVRSRVFDLERLAGEAISLEPGQEYGIDAIRESLQDLYALGSVSDVHVRARRDGDGVRVAFEVLPSVHVHAVRIEGDSPVGKSPLRDTLRIRPGDRLDLDAVERQAQRVQQALADRGYSTARVRPEVAFREQVSQGIVTFHLEPGTRTRLRSLEVAGVPRVPVGTLLARIELREGDTYRPLDLEAGLESIRDYLARQDYLHARVDVAEQAFNATANTVDLTIRVDAGPRVEIDISGLDRSREKLRDTLPIWEERSVEDWVLKETRHRIVSRLQSEGYWRPLVAYSRSRDEEGRNVTVDFRIVKGQKASLERIDFEGTESISPEHLRSMIQTRVGGLFDPARFDSRTWEKDQQAVASRFRAQGYLAARVAEAPVDYLESVGGLRASMRIEAGPRTLVETLELTTADGEPRPGVDVGAWLVRIPLQEGKPYSRQGFREGEEILRSLLSNAGYPRASVVAERSIDEETHRARVSYRLVPGDRARISRILIAGLEGTRPEVVRRELSIVPGSFYSHRGLIDSQSRLYRIGLFSQVQVQPAVADSLDDQRTVIVRVEEAPHNRMSWGFGYESEEGPRGLFSFGNDNLWGMNREALFSVRASFREQRVRAVYTEPYLFGRRLQSATSAFFESVQEESFDVERAGASYQVYVTHRPTLTSLARYSYRRVRTFDLQIESRLLEREDRAVDIGSLSYSVVRDTRPDPIEPRRGLYQTLDVEVASELLGSQSDFLRLFGRTYWYRRLGGDVVVAAAGRAGFLFPFAGDDDIPLPERFFTGGAASIRGLGRDRAGPQDEFGEALGGQVLLLGNLELRFPVRGDLGGVLFLDVGNVFADVDAIQLDDIREAAGVGLRYQTPIGPVRLDFGYLLDRRDDEDGTRIHFSIGHTF